MKLNENAENTMRINVFVACQPIISALEAVDVFSVRVEAVELLAPPRWD